MKRLVGMIALLIGLAGWTSATRAEPKDYVFVMTNNHITPSASAPITVQLIHGPTKRPVADAIIVQSRLEMPMPGMAPMAGKVAYKGTNGQGGYLFVADLAMQGSWILDLSAKVNGESGTVTGTIPLRVSPDSHNRN
ncbi:MAG: FixH family protein [Rhodospirillales bacterium]|nr:FixH family protein [Rhodospirillales bacterium]